MRGTWPPRLQPPVPLVAPSVFVGGRLPLVTTLLPMSVGVVAAVTAPEVMMSVAQKFLPGTPWWTWCPEGSRLPHESVVPLYLMTQRELPLTRA